MEKSPFDPPTDSSLHANLPPSCPASDNVPSLLDAPKKHSKKPLLLLLLIPFLGAGIYFYVGITKKGYFFEGKKPFDD